MIRKQQANVCSALDLMKKCFCNSVHPRLSESRLSESSHIRTAKSRIITVFINILMILIIVIELSCNIFFYVFHISVIRTIIFFACTKGLDK